MGIKVTFVSNYLTIHQISLCREFYVKLGTNFSFVSSFEPSGDKKKYADFENEPFVIRSYLSKKDRMKAIRVIDESDVVIFGSGDRSLIKNKKKMIFFYLEHISKNKINRLRKFHLRMMYSKFPNAYLLCASCYSQTDFNGIGLFLDRCFYFGYFPLLIDQCSRYANSKYINLLWVGRELPLKRPEYAFYAAEFLYQNGICFKLCIVSTFDNLIKDLIEVYKSKPWFKHIKLKTPIDNTSIQKLMSKSDIFIFSSDKNEGWGAVVNEAMNGGCCPIVSREAGCSSFLIKDGINGFLFNDIGQFKDELLLSVQNRLFEKIGINAADTIRTLWNAKTAVENLLTVFAFLIEGKDLPKRLINNGPGTKIL